MLPYQSSPMRLTALSVGHSSHTSVYFRFNGSFLGKSAYISDGNGTVSFRSSYLGHFSQAVMCALRWTTLAVVAVVFSGDAL